MNAQTLGVYAGSPPGEVAVWRAVARVLRSRGEDVVTTVVPACCRVCEGPLERVGAVPVCEGCVERVSGDAPAACWRCGDGLDIAFDMEDVRFAQGLGERLHCRACRMSVPDFERAVSFGTYDGELRALIGLLKFGRVRAVARVLGPKLGAAVLQLEGLAGAELLVVAVPLFAARQRERQFNQSVLLAGEALRWLRVQRPGWTLTPNHGLLVRQKSTESSFALSRRERRRNLAGAFRAEGEVRGREVLVIDDIFTSGATARECAKVLKRAGAAKVFVATLARSRRELAHSQGLVAEQVAAWDLGPG